jgi:hypothetical protein
MPLKPQNIVQAAEGDLARRERNRKRAIKPAPGAWYDLRPEGPMEPYAFHRAHVRAASNARDLIDRAITEPVVALGDDDHPGTAKVNTRMIYSNGDLLTAARDIAGGHRDGK